MLKGLTASMFAGTKFTHPENGDSRRHASPKRRIKHPTWCDNSEGHYLNNTRPESLKPVYCCFCCYVIHINSVTDRDCCWRGRR